MLKVKTCRNNKVLGKRNINTEDNLNNKKLKKYIFNSGNEIPYLEKIIDFIKDDHKTLYKWILVCKKEYNKYKDKMNFFKMFYETLKEDGKVYNGQTMFNKRNGYGKLTLSNGNVYEGEWKDDKPHGQGKMTWSNGKVYEGKFKAGMLHGQGKKTYADGDVYEGEWKDGKMHGQGKYTYTSGNVYEGEWKDDKFMVNGKMMKIKKISY